MMRYGEILYGIECDVEIFTFSVRWVRCFYSLLDKNYSWLCCKHVYLFV